jgi:phosphohistidine phosphatase
MNLILWRHADAEGGSPDSERRLTERGRLQADRVSAWLKTRLTGDCVVLVSPAVRARQTASALGKQFVTSPAIGVDASATDVVNAAGWPSRLGTVVIVGHQPTLGRVAAMLLSGTESDWEFAKGALWWLVHANGKIALRAAVDPELV